MVFKDQDAVQVVVITPLSVILPPFCSPEEVADESKMEKKRFTSFSWSLGDATGARD